MKNPVNPVDVLLALRHSYRAARAAYYAERDKPNPNPAVLKAQAEIMAVTISELQHPSLQGVL